MLERLVTPSLFHGLRAVERFLPPRVLTGVLWPFVAVFAFSRAIGNAGRVRSRSFAAAYGTPPSLLASVRAFIGETYGRLVTLWPDRLPLPRWKRRFTVTGLDSLLACQAEGRPVVLAIIHFHHMNLLRLFLRANGVPVASLTYGPGVTAIRRAINTSVDRDTPLTATPHKFSLAQLRAAYAFLRSGKCLLIACDKPSNDTVSLPTELGTIAVHLGPFRLAAMTNALVVPAIVQQERPWEFRVALGEPAQPPAHAADRLAFEPIAKHCLATWQSLIRDYPAQLTPNPAVWNVQAEQPPAD